MIEHQTIDGRPATVAYFDKDLNPADRDDFALAKIMFDDNGEHLWIAKDEEE